MKVCVYGLGAIGSFLAARLVKGGAEVSVVARGATLGAIRADGIVVHAPSYEIRVPIAAAADDPAALGPQDAVLVTVKAPALPNVAERIAPLLRPDTAVAFVMNGIPWWYFYAHGGSRDGERIERLDPGGRLWKTIGPERAIGGVTYIAVDVERPGVVHVETASPWLMLGEPDGSISERVQTLAGLIRGDTLSVEVVPDIRKLIWSKLQMNMSSGLLGCLSNSPPREIYGNPACADVVRRIVAEAGAIAAACGKATDFDAEAMLNRIKSQMHRSSIVQDLDSGRPIEFDAMFGIPLDMAQTAGVATPTLDFLSCLVRARARRAGSYTD